MRVTINQDDWKKVLAEVAGVFFFFFIGIGAAVIASANGGDANLSILYVALAHGISLSVAVTAFGAISGAHFNPAVTIGFLVVRRISPLLALLYILGQLMGGVLACLALAAVLPESAWRAINLGTPGLNPSINSAQGFTLEVILTFILVLAIFGTVVDPRPNRIAGFGIGLTVFSAILVGGPLTGAALNPARAFAPAAISGAWGNEHLIYWAGPIVGAVTGALFYTMVFLPRSDDEVVATPLLADDEPLEPPASEPGLLRDR